jgi:hypothetical protein
VQNTEARFLDLTIEQDGDGAIAARPCGASTGRDRVASRRHSHRSQVVLGVPDHLLPKGAIDESNRLAGGAPRRCTAIKRSFNEFSLMFVPSLS